MLNVVKKTSAHWQKCYVRRVGLDDAVFRSNRSGTDDAL